VKERRGRNLGLKLAGVEKANDSECGLSMPALGIKRKGGFRKWERARKRGGQICKQNKHEVQSHKHANEKN